jgi:chemotaxis signal transduction protein
MRQPEKSHPDTARYRDRFLILRRAQALYGIRLIAAAEVGRLPAVVAASQAGNLFIGYTGLHGQSVPVLDPARLTGALPPQVSNQEAKFVLCRNNPPFCVIADEVVRIAAAKPQNGGEQGDAWFDATIVLDGKIIPCLNVPWLGGRKI